MSRSKDEWIGATDDSKPPTRVRLRVFRAYGGRCYLSGIKIKAGDAWDLDHIKALEDGGQNRESNLAPALKAKHAEKTAAENSARAKADRIAAKHLGVYPASPTPMRSRNSFHKRRALTVGGVG